MFNYYAQAALVTIKRPLRAFVWRWFGLAAAMQLFG